MRILPAITSTVCLLLGGIPEDGGFPAPPTARAGDAGPTLEIELPADGAVLGPGACGVLVAGRAGVGPLDLVLVLDTSVSTAAPSGVDLDGDGRRGRAVFGAIGPTRGERSSDPDDSILAAEVAAARRLVAGLDPRRTRVALVTFSGGTLGVGPPGSGPTLPATVTRTPLSLERAPIDRALRELAGETPAGGTHMAAAVDRATVELLGLRGAHSRPEPAHDRAAVLLTDGTPTQPFGPAFEAENIRATLDAADRARRARVRITTLAVGAHALAGPIAALEIAERTGGSFVPVRQVGDALAAIEEVDLSGLAAIELRNLDTGEPASALRRTPDGSWAALVPVALGANRLEVVARGRDGGRTRRVLRVTLDPAAPPPALPRELEFLARGPLADCLQDARRIDLSAEEARAEQVRRELRVEIERERARARQRADQQRRRLELELETDAEAEIADEQPK